MGQEQLSVIASLARDKLAACFHKLQVKLGSRCQMKTILVPITIEIGDVQLET